ncbi:hypothetical protein HPB51_022653 [Rhipicephalus microplus]|uniref:BED-type domain-containing protein n=1 Tax=Rhipicephalus microplus TaxID=6941 RepID=A0A9J6E4Y7_RHIMP|nr:hypothetical protein HPB51_022653 [Rhipicephalus microplus]
MKTSYVWQHFGHLTYITRGKQKKIGTDYYCEKCLTKSSNDDDSKPFESCKIKCYASTVSTSNMQRHLVDELKLQDDNQGASRVTVKNYFQVVPRRNTTSSSRKNLLARNLVLLIARDLLPFNMVNGEGLQDFFMKYGVIKELQELPDRTTLSRSALDDVYRSMHGQVKKTVVPGPRFCAVTYDLWTDSYRRRAYITFTCHLVNRDMAYCRACKVELRPHVQDLKLQGQACKQHEAFRWSSSGASGIVCGQKTQGAMFQFF